MLFTSKSFCNTIPSADMKEKLFDDDYWQSVFDTFKDALRKEGATLPSVSQIAAEYGHDPYAVLVSTLISLRTRDEVTLEASRRLLSLAPDVHALAGISEETVADAIKPAGFYKRKAAQLKAIAGILLEKHGGDVPSSQEELLALPGVGIKTANLTLNLGFAVEAICVDCHVHQIANRIGWIDTNSPEESVTALEAIMPRRFWIDLNELLVSYGQVICTPVSPFCSKCPASGYCPRKGVAASR